MFNNALSCLISSSIFFHMERPFLVLALNMKKTQIREGQRSAK